MRAGWSFDTGLTPEASAELLTGDGIEQAPADSWLRLRGMERSAVKDGNGEEIAPWSGVTPISSVAERRAALSDLREQGYRLVAFVRWPGNSWIGGIRADNPLRRLPLDLREVNARTRALAATYGDLIDYWEIENEPDISFVEENPETYVAFLHAAGLGIRQGRQANAALNESGRLLSDSTEIRSQVLMAPLALPPGPWFEAFIANEGLRFTDAFNFHYYGYAEDFTGVYRQFEEAVQESPDTSAGNVAEFATQFYPNTANWPAWVLDQFDHPADWATENRAFLLDRPRAAEEPSLTSDGRWLVSDGVAVTEDGDTWRFQVDRPAPGPRRPAMAELPLPDGWVQDGDSLLGFEYRLVTPEPLGEGGQVSPEPLGEGGGSNGSMNPRPEGRSSNGSLETRLLSRVGISEDGDDSDQSLETRPSGRVIDLTAAQATRLQPELSSEGGQATSRVIYPSAAQAARLQEIDGDAAVTLSLSNGLKPRRHLPILLTEYGYGLLDATVPDLTEGREAQRVWFEQVDAQIRQLGIEGAMAFELRPYLLNGTNEFGLLTSTEGTLADNATPALEALLDSGRTDAPVRRWTVPEPAPPTSVVIDFVAGPGLERAKSYNGYLVRGSGQPPATGDLILYNLGSEPISGSLALEGSTWTLANRAQTVRLTLAPGERRIVSVTIAPQADRFEALPASATFTREEPTPTENSARPPSEAIGSTQPVPSRSTETVRAIAVRPAAEHEAAFDVYFRTRNGNLYQTWPRPVAKETWQTFGERLGNFTMAFFGRANLPWRFEENQPAALVFFFRPENYPATFEIRRPQILEISAE